jgi:hypothetical protein
LPKLVKSFIGWFLLNSLHRLGLPNLLPFLLGFKVFLHLLSLDLLKLSDWESCHLYQLQPFDFLLSFPGDMSASLVTWDRDGVVRIHCCHLASVHGTEQRPIGVGWMKG